MALSVLDWVIILAYIAFALGVGFYFTKRASESTDEYFLSGRTLPWWVLGTSMVATTFAADTPLAVTEMVRTAGIWKNWFWWTVAISGLLATFLFAPLWRRARVLTDQELIEIRYSGRPAAWLRGFKAVYFSILYNCIVMSWVIAGMSSVVSVLMDIPQYIAVIGCIVIALVYSVFSGFWGVVVTDLVQFVIAMGGAIVLAVIAISRIGGLAQLMAKLEPARQRLPHLLDFFPSPSTGGGDFLNSPFFILMVFVTVKWWANQNADGGGYLIQRMGAAKNETHALFSALWFNFAQYALRVWPWVVVALVSLVLYPNLATHPCGDKAGYPLVLRDMLGSGLRGLLVVSFLAAFMSTIDTHLNWGASYLVNDIYRRFIKPDADEAHYVTVSKISVVFLMLLAGLSSLAVTSISAVWELVHAMGAGLGIVLILRWFWWRINAYSEITALASSLLVMLVIKLVGWLYPKAVFLGFKVCSLPFHIKLLTIVPVSALCWIAATFLTQPEPDETLRAFYKRVCPGGWWGKYRDDDTGYRTILGWDFLANWIAGSAMVYGSMFAIGYGLFGTVRNCLVSVAIALTGTIVLYVNLSRMLAGGETLLTAHEAD